MSYDTLVAEATARPDGPTKKQIDFVLKLAGERRDDVLGYDGMDRMEQVAARIEAGATRRQVSQFIAHLLTKPIDQREVTVPAPRGSSTIQRGGLGVPQQPKQPKQVDPELTPGVYEIDNRIYVVKPNKDKTRLYAKRLVETKNERFTESGDLLKIEFVYEPGAIFDVKPAHRMDFERAQALTIKFNHCIVCGRRLKAGKSVKLGIGPVCRKLFA
jgi:hypothetical protein